MSPIVKILRTGRLKYAQGLKLQQKITKSSPTSAEDGKSFQNVLILTEHDPVYTIGIRTKNYTAEDEMRLKNLGADFFKTNRGGLITFHGPGQLVAYPILNLKEFTPSIRWYIKQLEITIIDACKAYGIEARTTDDTGIWVGDNKICALGVHGSRFVTSHGLALNCNTDLNWFEHIVPCGIEGKGVTSLTNELNRKIQIEQATPIFLDSFKRIFQCNLIEMDADEQENILLEIKK